MNSENENIGQNMRENQEYEATVPSKHCTNLRHSRKRNDGK